MHSYRVKSETEFKIAESLDVIQTGSSVASAGNWLIAQRASTGAAPCLSLTLLTRRCLSSFLGAIQMMRRVIARDATARPDSDRPKL